MNKIELEKLFRSFERSELQNFRTYELNYCALSLFYQVVYRGENIHGRKANQGNFAFYYSALGFEPATTKLRNIGSFLTGLYFQYVII